VKPSNFITVTQGGSGWFAVEMWYNNQDYDDYGFWEHGRLVLVVTLLVRKLS